MNPIDVAAAVARAALDYMQKPNPIHLEKFRIELNDALGELFDGDFAEQTPKQPPTDERALSVLRAYASIVASEPGQHTVTVVPVEAVGESLNLDSAGVWIVLNNVVETLRSRRPSGSLPLTDPRQLLRTLQDGGLLGVPTSSKYPKWIGGFWKRTGEKWEPARKIIKHFVRGLPVRLGSYLIPAAVIEKHQIKFA